jgi:hypothetical protein
MRTPIGSSGALVRSIGKPGTTTARWFSDGVDRLESPLFCAPDL